MPSASQQHAASPSSLKLIAIDLKLLKKRRKSRREGCCAFLVMALFLALGRGSIFLWVQQRTDADSPWVAREMISRQAFPVRTLRSLRGGLMRYALLASTQYMIRWFDSLFESSRDTTLIFRSGANGSWRLWPQWLFKPLAVENPALHLHRRLSSFLHSSSCISNHFNDKSIETDSTSEFPMMFALNMSINFITVGIWLFAIRDRTVVSPDDQTMTPQELNQN